jgi:alpha-beta hydrolase superfamily lysophospholipase
MPDFRGCGDSEGAVTTLGMREADDVAAAVAWAKPRLAGRPLVLFGGSMGAAAVLRAIATGQIEQPTGVVLEAPFDRLLNTIRRRFDAMGVPSFPAAESLTFWGGWQHGFNGFALNPSDDARHVRVPTLVLIGGADPWVSVGQAFAVASHVNGPHVMRVFPDAGHQSLVESSPDLYRRTLGRWLRDLAMGQR